jgi:hypothetical protein
LFFAGFSIDKIPVLRQGFMLQGDGKRQAPPPVQDGILSRFFRICVNLFFFNLQDQE